MQGKVVKTAHIPVPSRDLVYTIVVRRLGRRRFVLNAHMPKHRYLTFTHNMRIVQSLKEAETTIAHALMRGYIDAG